MITEKHFSLSHAAFWRQLLPMSESYMRECNGTFNWFERPLNPMSPSHQRGFINELGFRLFAIGLELKQHPSDLSKEILESSIKETLHYISRFRQLSRQSVSPPDEYGCLEAKHIAERIHMFCCTMQLQSLQTFPLFLGCGWLGHCQGDLLSQNMLIEVKSGERGFRSADIRQVLCYCALNFASKEYEISKVCLLNPRSGKYISESLEKICYRLSGRSATEVLSEIVEYISEPFGRY